MFLHCKFVGFLTFIVLIFNVNGIFAELPPSLPGYEITDQILQSVIPADTSKSKEEKNEKPKIEWYDVAAKTWEAPIISEQMSKDLSVVPLGKGGVFIPRLTELHKEPDIQIVDSSGHTVTSGRTGITYSLEPGKYSVLIGSGTHRQRIVKQITIQEFKNIPVLPDWSGLVIETIDTNSTVFKGEYELVRIDKFEPFGRGYGADIAMGEAVKTWILKPGIYKILGRGESYNTLKNFITVRLMPGELSRVVLIEKNEELTILGGGIIDIDAGTKIASNWKYGGSIGGNIQFVNDINRKGGKNYDISSIISLNSNFWVRFLNNPVEWETSISLKEGASISRQSQISSYSVQGAPDDFKTNSLFIWRFLKWFGPFVNTELATNLLPKNIIRDQNEFIFVVKNDSIDFSESNAKAIMRLNPSFCPLNVDVNGGANIDALNLNFLDITVRLGAGSTYSDFPDKYTEILDKKNVHYDRTDPALVSKAEKSTLLRFEKRTRVFEFGPSASVSSNVRLGRFGTAGVELKLFAPLLPKDRLKHPDSYLNTIVSWRIARAVTLDYEFVYQMKRPADDYAAKVDQTSNMILLRFSYSSR